MSTARLSSLHKIHRRNNSGEFHVFGPTRYFPSSQGPNRAPNIPTRMSLDVLMFMRASSIIPPDFCHGPNQKQPKSDNKKHSQPSSPGSRLASFLNSLFNQATLKKKKPKPDKDFDHKNTLGGARRKRSSTDHFRIIRVITGNNNNNNMNSKKSGFGMHSPYVDTPTKSYNAISKPPVGKRGREIRAERKECGSWIFEGKSRVSAQKDDIGFLDWSPEERERGKLDYVDDGADSDSSSDLFDLPSCELDFYRVACRFMKRLKWTGFKIVEPINF